MKCILKCITISNKKRNSFILCYFNEKRGNFIINNRTVIYELDPDMFGIDNLGCEWEQQQKPTVFQLALGPLNLKRSHF